MANIPELLDGHVTLEVECLDRLYLNGYIGGLATPGGLVTFMRVQLGKPISVAGSAGSGVGEVPRGGEGAGRTAADSDLSVPT